MEFDDLDVAIPNRSEGATRRLRRAHGKVASRTACAFGAGTANALAEEIENLLN
jgi:hypothetical protein